MKLLHNLLIRHVEDVEIAGKGQNHAHGHILPAHHFTARDRQRKQFRRGVHGNADRDLPSRLRAAIDRRMGRGDNLAGPGLQIIGNGRTPVVSGGGSTNLRGELEVCRAIQSHDAGRGKPWPPHGGIVGGGRLRWNNPEPIEQQDKETLAGGAQFPHRPAGSCLLAPLHRRCAGEGELAIERQHGHGTRRVTSRQRFESDLLR